MNQIIVRRIDDDLKARLKKRAEEHGVSMEEEVRIILQNALLREEPRQPGLGTRIAALFKDIEDGPELEPLPREDLKPINFDE